MPNASRRFTPPFARTAEVCDTFFADLDGARRICARDEEIYAEESAADFVYEVVEGVVRTCRLLSDGRRQIEDFYLPGDVFGLEAGLMRRAAAEAVGPVTLKVVRRTTLSDLATRDADLARKLWSLTARDLRRTQDHLLMLGRRSATERVAGFLLDLAERTDSEDVLDLPMSRQDIADYLGLTIETVSRTFTQLQNTGLIEAPSCRHLIVDLEALEDLCA
ncbi:MAG: helix-turn-helix domain-containing protein [Proteobacteria bacterium]|nr:helix-turn-helix domain-containing protein [Pseudomonadota bacterium]